MVHQLLLALLTASPVNQPQLQSTLGNGTHTGTTTGTTTSNYVIDTTTVRLTLTPAGKISEIFDKAGQKNLVAVPASFSGVQVNGQLYGATSISVTGTEITASYAGTGVQAQYHVTATDSAIVFHLDNVSGSPDRVYILRAPIQSFGPSASIVGLRADASKVAAVTGTTRNVRPMTLSDGSLSAASDAAFGLTGGAALVLSPRFSFLTAMHGLEVAEKVPFTTVDGIWAKKSPATAKGYLFTDPTSSNIDQAISYAKRGGLDAIMLMVKSWTDSSGTYTPNKAYWPGGDPALITGCGKIRSAGLKVGLHVTSNAISWSDPMVPTGLSNGLLRDAQADLNASLTSSSTALNLSNWTALSSSSPPAAPGDHLLIDNEVVLVYGGSYPNFMVHRGQCGTTVADHSSGATVIRFASRYNMALVDLASPMKDVLASNIANAIKRYGAQMVYFDYMDTVAAQGPYWYWGSELMQSVYAKVGGDLLIMGNMVTSWNWHLMARGTADDFAALDPGDYLDTHKLDVADYYSTNFLPCELGWWGLLTNSLDHPATTLEDFDRLGARMVAMNMPVGVEADMEDMQDNGRTSDLLDRLKLWDSQRSLSSSAVTSALGSGDWSIVRSIMAPQKMVAASGADGEKPNLSNPYALQPLSFRLTMAGDTLDESGGVIALTGAGDIPRATGPTAGELATSVVYPTPIDMSSGIGLKLDLSNSSVANPPDVLDVELEGTDGMLRDYYVTLNFTGRKTLALTTPTTAELFGDLAPDPSTFAVKHSLYTFNYHGVRAVNFRWIRANGGSAVHIYSLVATAIKGEVIDNPLITAGGLSWRLKTTVNPGEYMQWNAGDTVVGVYDASGHLARSVKAPIIPLYLSNGVNKVSVRTHSQSRWKITTFARDLSNSKTTGSS